MQNFCCNPVQKFQLPALLFLILCLWSTTQAGEPPDFSHDVVPILRQHCAQCHTGEKQKGGLSMNTRESLLAGSENGPVVRPGKSAESPLIVLVTSSDDNSRMPPDGPALSAPEVQALRDWIDAGLPWTPGFAFQKSAYEPPLHPRRPDLPAAIAGRDNPVDRILDACLRDKNLARPKPLDAPSFLRRVHLDLVGLLPEPTALEKFLADTSPDKRAALVRNLLADQIPYTEHWLTFWNDLLRNDYSGTGYIDGGRKQITTWLYRSLLENKPYDQMARELIAPSSESEGFARGIKWRGDVSAGQTVPIQFAQSVGQAFLGINLKCASCHDSFIDRWKLDDAYGLAAIYSETPLEIHRCDKPLGRKARAAWLFPELGQIDPSTPAPDRLKQLAGLMTLPQNGRFTRTLVNRLWHRLMGRGIVHPTDAMQSEPWNADLLDFLATDFADAKYDIKHTLELICTSQAYQSQAQVVTKDQDDHGYLYAGPRAKRLTAEQFLDAVWQLTGTAPLQPDSGIKRPKPPASALSNDTASASSAPAVPHMIRAALMKSDPLMRALGRPNREQIVSMRPNDLTTLEALDLNNGHILASRLDTGSRNLLAKNWASGEALVQWLYLHALSRPPTPAELALAREVIGTPLTPEGLQDLVWSICMLPEFQLVR